MSLQVNCVTAKGGAVEFNSDQGVWASYAVATVADRPPPEIFQAGLQLDDGHHVVLFVHRQTGLIVVDVVQPVGQCGEEVFRWTVTPLAETPAAVEEPV